MNVLIPKEVLSRALAHVQGILKRDTNPMLGCVLLHARHDKLVVTATDTLVTLRAEYPATVLSEGLVAVPGQTLFHVVRAAPGEQVELVQSGTRLRVRAGSSVSHLNVMDADDFPPVTKVEAAAKSMTLQGGVLARLIDAGAYAVSDQENRYGLNGVHLESVHGAGGQRVRMVTTDGSRLAYAEGPYEGEIGLNGKHLLSPKGVSELRRIISAADQPWTITWGNNAVVYASGGVQLIARHVDGEFPDYKQVLPSSFRCVIQMDRAAFIEAAKRISVFATDRNHTTTFKVTAGRLELTAENIDTGDAREEVPVDVLDGEEIRTGFNLTYLTEALGVTRGKRITLSLEGGGLLGPSVVRAEGEDDIYGLVMPMRVD